MLRLCVAEQMHILTSKPLMYCFYILLLNDDCYRGILLYTVYIHNNER